MSDELDALEAKWCRDEGVTGTVRRKRLRAALAEACRLGRAEMREEIASYVAPFGSDSGTEAWALACEIRALSVEDEP